MSRFLLFISNLDNSKFVENTAVKFNVEYPCPSLQKCSRLSCRSAVQKKVKGPLNNIYIVTKSMRAL